VFAGDVFEGLFELLAVTIFAGIGAEGLKVGLIAGAGV
jgi:hypothetical protein